MLYLIVYLQRRKKPWSVEREKNRTGLQKEAERRAWGLGENAVEFLMASSPRLQPLFGCAVLLVYQYRFHVTKLCPQ